MLILARECAAPTYDTPLYKLPAYLAREDFLGVVGLRWKLPALRLLPNAEEIPGCFLCGEPGGECRRHLLACRQLWNPCGDPLGAGVMRLRQKVRCETKWNGAQAAQRVERCILRLAWSNQRPETLTLALRVAHGLLNRYRRCLVWANREIARTIWPLRVYGVGSEDELLSEDDDASIEASEASDADTIEESETGEA